MEPTFGQTGLIDTDILIDALRGYENAILFLSNQFKQECIQISVISAMELIRGSLNAHDMKSIQAFLNTLTIFPLNRNISFRTYSLINDFTLSHRIEIPDAIIAATALENGFTLYTKNLKHYRMIPDLLLTRPY